MQIHIVYFVHSETADNHAHLATGWLDTDISLTGISQSMMLREAVRSRAIDIVYCSDLRRAVHTARLAFDEIAPIVADARLRECNYGDFNGKPSSLVESHMERSVEHPFPGGESYEDVKRRVTYFLREIQIKHPGQTVGIVSHKGPQLALEVLLAGHSWHEAIAHDWRLTGEWKPGWEYTLTTTTRL